MRGSSMSAGESESLVCLKAVQGLEANTRASGAPGSSNDRERTKNSTCVAATDEAQRLFAFFRCRDPSRSRKHLEDIVVRDERVRNYTVNGRVYV